jgi:hypothetical protein
VSLFENHHEDLWIYRSAAEMGRQGISPYNPDRIHTKVAEQYPSDDNFINNSAFMYPPPALLVYAPLTFVSWEVAKPLWCGVSILIGAAAAWGLRRFSDSSLPGWFPAAAVAAVLLNPLSMFTLVVGQTPLLFLACVTVGQWVWVNGWKRFGCLLWAVAFLKPHIALPLLPLAWYLGGWRRAVEVVAWVAVLNIVAGLVMVGDPLFVWDYLWYIQQGHQSVEFNRVAVNKQITGWNRLVVAGGGPAIELGMAGTVAGYLVLGGLATGRLWLGGVKPTASWMLAVTGCAALVCCQLLPYELPLLCLTLPYLGELLASGRSRDKLATGFILAAATFAMLPGGEASDWYRFVRGLQLSETATNILFSHRCIGVLAVAAGVLANGPLVHRRRERLVDAESSVASADCSFDSGA